jgi:hypothetical protein
LDREEFDIRYKTQGTRSALFLVLPKIIWKFNPTAFSLRQFLLSLIKKGRGLWPDEALTTYPANLRLSQKGKGANSIPPVGGTDKSDQQLQIIFHKIFKAHLIYRVSFFVARRQLLPGKGLLPGSLP